MLENKIRGIAGDRFLVVDDEEGVRKFVRRALESKGARVEAAQDFDDAELLLQKMPFDMAFVDIYLPGKNGVDVFQNIKSIQPDVPVVFMTGYPSVETATEALKRNASDYLVKPISAANLLEVASNVLENKRNFEKVRRREKAQQVYREKLETLVEQKTVALDESEERYRRLFEDSRDAILITAPNGEFIDFNGSALSLLGYQREEMLALKVRDICANPDDCMDCQRILEREGSVSDYEIRLKTKEGRPVVCMLSTTVRRGSGGNVIEYQTILHDVTKRKHAEERVVEQNVFLTTVLESLAHPFYVIDAKSYEIVLANSAAHFDHKLPPATCYAMTHNRNSPCDGRDHPCPLTEIKRTRKHLTVEHMHTDTDGRKRFVEIHGHPIFDEEGEVVQVIEYAIDITDRVNAETALKKNETKFREFFNDSPFMMLSFDSENRVLDMNRKWRKETGVDGETVIGKPLDLLMPSEEAADALQNELSEFWEHGMIRDVPLKLRTQGDECIDIKLDGNIIDDVNGGKLGIAVAQNVTEQRKTQEELYRLKAVIEQSKDGVLITDPTGRIQYANPAFETISGYAPEDVLGKDCQSLGSKKVSTSKSFRIWEAARQNEGWRSQLVSRKKDGTIYQEECSISPIRDKGGDVKNYVMVKRDITEKKHLESIAESANLMENIGFVFSGVRHELGNPINTIKMTLNVLSANLDRYSPEKINEFIQRAIGAVKRVEYLLKALKNFSLFERPHPTTVCVSSFMESLMQLVSEDLKKKSIAIQTEVSKGPDRMTTDPRALQQVLLNLIVNAAEALEDTDNPEIRVRVTTNGSRTQIVVQDNGCGIPDYQQRQLFKPFFTTKPTGTGLGLVIAKKMLIMMKGSIDIESREGFCTRVTVSLPAASEGTIADDQNTAGHR